MIPLPGSPDVSANAHKMFDQGGEMGTLLRSIDWSKTTMGPVSGWSQALQTMIGVLLRSRFPMHLSWGPQLVQFYNDAYRPILGAKHPRAMGQPVSECWPEIWHVMEPIFAGPFSGKPATWMDDLLLLFDRKGFLEETHFKAAYSPVPDEATASGIGGVLATVSETTEQVYGQRQLKTLREIAARAAEAQTPEQACATAAATLGENAADVPFCLFYLLSPDGKQARRVAGSGFGAEEGPANPAVFDLTTPTPEGTGWALARSFETRTINIIKDLPQRLGVLPQGPWAEPPHRAICLPLASPDQPRPYGVMIAGVNPHRELDDGYQTFFELAAAQVVTAIHNARAHEEARVRAEKLAEIARVRTAFFSNVSHEFRTPLTLILGTTEGALGPSGGALSGESLDTVHRNALRLLRLVNTLLDFSRLEAGRARAKPQATDLSAFTTDLASTFRSLVEKSGVTLAVDCPPLAEPVFIDREMYEKIVLNLLSNAFKFTFEGEIRVSLRVLDARVLLTVADTGVGIPEAELPNLFGRFHRVEGAKGRSYEGSGIGLALVQELAALNGGVVSAESRLGEGSRFTVSLPLGSAHLPSEHREPAAPQLAAPGPAVAPFLDEATQWLKNGAPANPALPDVESRPRAGSPAESGRVLLADDNADMREYVRRLLTEKGWEVEAVSDGEQALESARARPPDLVLSDVMMPVLDGIGLLRALKGDERTHAVPVILLSARAGEEAAIEGMEQGADDYLVKPFSARGLVSMVAARVEIARARAEAVRARSWLFAQVMQAPVAVCVLSGPEFIFALANPLYLEMCGRKDVVGKTLQAVFPELGPDSPVLQLYQRIYASGEPFIAEEYRVPLDRKGEGVLEDAYFKFTGQPVRNAAGKVTDIMVVAIDVTAQVVARRQVESLLAELKLADQRKDEFLATLAHELRNPMAAISMALLLLEHGDGDLAKTTRYRETARRQMQGLVRLVDDLLDVSRITRGTVELRKDRVSLAALIQNAVTATRPAVEARGHGLEVTVGAGAFPMDADATRLEQVVVNLLTNATKYTDPGGTLSVRLDREGTPGAAHAVLRVRDSGRGIPVEMLDKVFELFVQVEPSLDRGTGGLGLGLTLVKRMVELHGGTVRAYSDGAGRGSEFVVRLPLASEPAPRAQLPAEGPVRSAVGLGKRRVLVVEDSEDVRDTLRDFLEDLGHEVSVAGDGLQGAAKVLELRPDVSLIDAGLPGIDGYEVARRVRAAPGGDQLYLVALTGYGGPDAKARAKEAGFNLHLTKPVDVNELARLLSGSKARANGAATLSEAAVGFGQAVPAVR